MKLSHTSSNSLLYVLDLTHCDSMQTHKFMAGLTECASVKTGHTVLYIPHLDLDEDVLVAVKNKELVQLMESCIIHSTRQVKEVLNLQDGVDEGGHAGPIQEIDFWRSRSTDLSSIRYPPQPAIAALFLG